MSIDTPLLLIAWRRPHTLRQVIDAIRSVIETEIDWPRGFRITMG